MWALYILYSLLVAASYVGAVLYFSFKDLVLDADLTRNVERIRAVIESSSFALVSLTATPLVGLVLAGLVGLQAEQGPAARLGWGQPRLDDKTSWLGQLACVAVAMAFTSLGAVVPLFKIDGADALAAQMASMSLPQQLWAFIVIAVLAPLGEETFFRGVMQRRFVERWGARKGIIWASIAFAGVHFEPAYVLFAFVSGYYLGLLAQRSDSLRPSLTAHVATNALFVITSVLPMGEMQRFAHWVLLLLTVPVAVYGAVVLRRAPHGSQTAG